MVDSRNKANGVALADGTEIKAKVVLSNATPKVTYLDLLHAVSMLPSTVLKLMFRAVVDGVYKTWIFIQCSCLIAPCLDIWIGIVKNQDAPSWHWKEGRRLVLCGFIWCDYLHVLMIWSITASIALVQGLWVWWWFPYDRRKVRISFSMFREKLLRETRFTVTKPFKLRCSSFFNLSFVGQL